MAVRVRRRGAVSRRGLLQRRARALGAEHGRDARRDDRHDPGRRTDRRRTGESAPGLRARPSAHRGDRVAAGTGGGTRHPCRDGSRRSRRSAIGLGATGALVHPARNPVDRRLDRHPRRRSRPPCWMTSASTRRRRRGFGSRSASPAHGIAGFRQSHNEAVQARRVAELAGRPSGTHHPLRARRAHRDRDRRPRPGPHFRRTRAARPGRRRRSDAPGSRRRCAPTSTSTPAAAAPPNGSASTRTPVSYRIKQAEDDPRAQRR